MTHWLTRSLPFTLSWTQTWPVADGAAMAGGTLGSGTVEGHGDHRVAMSFAVAGLLARGGVRIQDCSNVATSFPGFMELANGCGFALARA